MKKIIFVYGNLPAYRKDFFTNLSKKLEENDIEMKVFYGYFTNKVTLPVIKSPCPADGNTERESMKQLLRELDRTHKGLRYRIFGAIQRGEVDGFREFGRMAGVEAYDDSNE